MSWKEQLKQFIEWAEHTDFVTSWLFRILVALGLGDLSVWLIDKLTPLSGNPRVAVWLISSAVLVWLLSLLMRYFRSTIEHLTSNPRTVANLAIILLLALAGWIWVLSEKVSNIQSAIDCLVTPRHLTDDQIAKIAEFLSAHESHEIILNRIRDDTEASSYQGDFYRAFEKGGWTITAVNIVPESSEGTHLNFTQTQESAQQKPDAKHPKPDVLLQQALKQADVEIEGSGGQSGVAISKNSLSLTVGHRRHDRYACTEERKKSRQEMLLRQLSN